MNIRCLCWSGAVLVGLFWPRASRPGQPGAGAAREVRSPDGKIAITIHTDAPLGYSITVDGKPALARSRLGLELADNVKLGENPVVQSEERKSADTHWENQFGKNRDVRDHYNELTLTLKEGDRTFGVVARAYDDGVAFRLVLPKQPGMDSFTVTRDATEFTFTDDDQSGRAGTTREGAARPEGGFIGSQEWRYLPNKLSGLNPNFKHGLPFLVQTPAAYVAITESDLLDWSGHVARAQGRREVHVGGATRPADSGAAVGERRAGGEWGGGGHGGCAGRRGSERPGCRADSSQFTLADIHHWPAGCRPDSERPGVEPRHAGQARRHLLDQAGHVRPGALGGPTWGKTTFPPSRNTFNSPPTWAGHINCRKSATSQWCLNWWLTARNAA